MWALLLLGALLRWRVLASAAGRLDGDEAVVGLMADRIRAGHAPPLFFWGQKYGGTGEVVLTALSTTIHRSAFMVKLVPLVLCGVASILVARLGKRMGLVKERARFAGAVMFAWPGTVWIATKERGFYWIMLVLVLTAMLIALRIAAQGTRSWAPRDALLLGFVIGLGWYQSTQVVFALIPFGVWFLIRHRPSLRATGMVFVGLAIGAAQWLYGLWLYGSEVFAHQRHDATFFGRVRLVFQQLLGRALGLRVSYGGGWLFNKVGFVVYVAALVALLCGLAAVVRGKAPALEPFVWVAVAMPWLIAIPSATSPVFEPRFGLLLVPIAACLVGLICTTPRRVIVAAAILASFGIANTIDVVHRADAERFHLDLAPARFDGLADALAQRHITHLYADFWAAYPFSFETGSRFSISALDLVRNPYARKAVDAARARTWLLFANGSRDKALGTFFNGAQIRYRREVIARDFVIYTIDHWVDPTTFATAVWRHKAGRL